MMVTPEVRGEVLARARGMLEAARLVGTRAHMSEAQDSDQGVAITLRYLEKAIQKRAAQLLSDVAP